MQCSLISHQTGACFSELSDQMIEFMAILLDSVMVQMAKEQAPTFQDKNKDFDSDRSTRKHAKKLTMGTRGNVGSIIRCFGALGRVRLLLYTWDSYLS